MCGKNGKQKQLKSIYTEGILPECLTCFKSFYKWPVSGKNIKEVLEEIYIEWGQSC